MSIIDVDYEDALIIISLIPIDIHESYMSRHSNGRNCYAMSSHIYKEVGFLTTTCTALWYLIPCSCVHHLVEGFSIRCNLSAQQITGCLELLSRSALSIKGKHAVVVGRTNIVGLPVSLLLLKEDATVSIVHSRTKEPDNIVREPDIVIAAAGQATMIKGSWIKPGAAVIDVGTNAVDDPTKKTGYRLVGDVDFEEASQVARFPGCAVVHAFQKGSLGLKQEALMLEFRSLTTESDVMHLGVLY